MFEKISDIWQKYGFDLLVILSIIFLLLYALCRIGKRGSYNKHILIEEGISDRPKKSKDSRGELSCRGYLERLFSRSFAKARPDFLNNPVTGGKFNLELDCYNPELKLALEYHGAQHYKFTPHFHKSREAFYNQKYRDQLKRMLCRENGISLIEVPYNVDNIENYINDELVKFGFL